MNILTDSLMPILGGILIGTSATLLLYWNGRIAGISGILYGFLNFKSPDWSWRFSFLSGLLVGGVLLALTQPYVFGDMSQTWNSKTIAAGLLVGFGTILGSGCTSGHGVCGISRLSPRSIIATMTFISMGIITVKILRTLGLLI